MESKTMNHLERYNKEFNFDSYWDSIKGVSIREDEDGFYKDLMQATFNSNKLLKSKHINVDKEYEKIKNDDDAKRELYNTYRVMYAFGSWLDFKQIYKFDLDTLSMVANSKFNDLTCEELKALKMPYDTFIIENDFEYRGNIIDTIIINRQVNEEYDNVLLMMYGFIRNDNQERMLRLDLIVEKDKTLNDFLVETAEEDCQEFVKKVMNLIMYLCQPKVEILKKRIEKKNDTSEKKKVKHFYKVSYDDNVVGVELGNAIRNYKYVYEKGESTPGGKKGSVKKPHLRCGHYQRYWLGSRKLEKRDFVVKFIAPIFVKGGANKIATLHNVK